MSEDMVFLLGAALAAGLMFAGLLLILTVFG